MARAIWTGSISFGLVNIPIRLYPATEDHEISFRTLHDKCNTPLEYKRYCPVCKTEVSWENVDKGFQVTKGKFVVLKKADFERIKLKTTKTIDILQFVNAARIDPIFYNKHYFIAPEKGAEQAYSLFKEALELSGMMALGKVVMRNREHLVALRWYGKGLLMSILYYKDEVKSPEDFEEIKQLVAVRSDAQLKLARLLIDQLAKEDFEISDFKDEYRKALQQLVSAKLKGEEFLVEKPPTVEAARDLMSALKASVEQFKKKKKKKIEVEAR